MYDTRMRFFLAALMPQSYVGTLRIERRFAAAPQHRHHQLTGSVSYGQHDFA
jgi:hypothetical protein